MRLANPTGQTCQETKGFLFHHPCAQPAINQCDQCQKLCCELHGVIEGTSVYCITCAKKMAQSASGGARPGYRRGDYSDDDDAYWYSDSYYHGYGNYSSGHWGSSHASTAGHSPPRDPNDFTPADTQSVQAEGDANFEQEIGGS